METFYRSSSRHSVSSWMKWCSCRLFLDECEVSLLRWWKGQSRFYWKISACFHVVPSGPQLCRTGWPARRADTRGPSTTHHVMGDVAPAQKMYFSNQTWMSHGQDGDYDPPDLIRVLSVRQQERRRHADFFSYSDNCSYSHCYCYSYFCSLLNILISEWNVGSIKIQRWNQKIFTLTRSN